MGPIAGLVQSYDTIQRRMLRDQFEVGVEKNLACLTFQRSRKNKSLKTEDVLLWRFLFLWMVASYLRAAKQVPRKVGLLLEQPASPRKYMPECVSFWDTSEWKSLRKNFGLKETTFLSRKSRRSCSQADHNGWHVGFEG